MQKNNEPVPTDYRGRPFKKTQEKAEDKAWWELLAEKAKTARDIVLVGAGLVYLVGFIEWSLYASSKGLGFVIVSQVQYITTGIWDLLFCCVIYVMFSVGKWLVNDRQMHPKNVMVFVIVFVLVLLIISAIITTKASGHDSPALNLTFFAISMVEGLGFGVAWAQLTKELQSRHKDLLHAPDSAHKKAGLAVAVFSLTTGAICLTFLIEPFINQEFGGTEPRCAILSLKRTDLTYVERKMLLPSWEQAEPADPSKDTAPIATSVPLYVYFDNQDQLDVRPESAPKSVMFELKRSNIVNIEWFGYSFPQGFLKIFNSPPPATPTKPASPKPTASIVPTKKKP